ncbi:MAG: response regulator transcription factor [Desulfobulbaceae bacterium]|nr:response regulator transcription factor [Desulfobulbaceae bacterium]
MPTQQHPTAGNTKQSPPLAAPRPKVLVAEDNAVVRKGLSNFLDIWGYQAVEADNGNDAWQALESDHQIRLAIVDWNLPGLSGMQICQRLRVRTKGPYVYTIMFSGRTSEEEQVLALDGGADDYIAKPTKPSLLCARLGVGRRIMETLAPTSIATGTKESNTE